MTERAWFYHWEERPLGPIAESALREEFTWTRIPLQTPVWAEGEVDWAPACELPAFSSIEAYPAGPAHSSSAARLPLEQPKPPEAPPAPAQPAPPQPAPRPKYTPPPPPPPPPRGLVITDTPPPDADTSLDEWNIWPELLSRIGARMIDLALTAALAYLFCRALGGQWEKFGFTSRIFIFVAVAMLGEVISLAAFGSTAGKALLRVRLTNRDGDPCAASQALLRTGIVYLLGLGLGLWPLMPFALLLARVNFSNSRTAAWDSHAGLTVSCETRNLALVVLSSILAGATLLFFIFAAT